MPTSVDRINVKIPRRLRRRLPEGYVVSMGKPDYEPVNINGVICQKTADAICDCIGIVMSERLIQASENAYTNGYIDKIELDRLKKEIKNV